MNHIKLLGFVFHSCTLNQNFFKFSSKLNKFQWRWNYSILLLNRHIKKFSRNTKLAIFELLESTIFLNDLKFRQLVHHYQINNISSLQYELNLYYYFYLTYIISNSRDIALQSCRKIVRFVKFSWTFKFSCFCLLTLNFYPR